MRRELLQVIANAYKLGYVNADQVDQLIWLLNHEFSNEYVGDLLFAMI